MRKSWNKFSRTILLVAAVIICIVLIVASAVMLDEYSSELRDQAAVKGLLYATDTSSYLKKSIDKYINETALAAQILAGGNYDSVASFASELRVLGRQERYSRALFGRFFLNGVEYTMGGSTYSTSDESSVVLRYMREKRTGCAGYVVDRQYNVNAVAFVAPIENCAYADVLVLYYPVDVISGFASDLQQDYLEQSIFTGLCAGDGEILSLIHRNEEESVQQHANVYEYLRDRINDKSTIDEIQTVVNQGGTSSFNVVIGVENYVVSVCSVGDVGTSFSIIALYRSSEIYSSGYSTINTLLTLLIVFFVIFIFFAIYAIISQRRTNKRILTLNDTNQRIHCDSGVKFERDADAIISQNLSSSFAVIVIDMKHYRYISDQFGRDVVTQILLYLKMLFSKAMQLNETFGYMGSGRFVLLLHYRESDQLMKRLSILSDLARKYPGKLPSNYHIDLYGGIYETKNGFTNDVAKMIDFALEAKDAGFEAGVGSFHYYNEELQQAHILTEYIEVHMNSALENKNFIVFYQPKYNIKGDRPDGSEALVRWYNPEQDQYMVPGLFLPLFESNGFIVKLDKFVYEQVCIYMEQAVELGQPLIPVSVNVSRATAAQSDFVDYYVSRKKAHRIADGFLTIEFTESFAYENYDALREMIVKLHQNGFKCSIDDFGSGYSSYNILKELPMDEIKLDRFFIHRGLSEERDAAILSSVISVAKKLNMKVTQEGVETEEQLELLKQLGCDVIQGYHYAKPLYLSDYVDFISRASHSHFNFR